MDAGQIYRYTPAIKKSSLYDITWEGYKVVRAMLLDLLALLSNQPKLSNQTSCFY